ncbi:MAG TPA: hypothetical protein VJS66_05245 [Burkholderiales bacterium]|nr:hypothetical protein [Burkholderiales bacterium]
MNQLPRLALLLCVVAVTSLFHSHSSAQISFPFVTITTDCGTGRFSFDPYPPIVPAGAPLPLFLASDDAYCVTAGSVITIEDFRTVYPDAVSVIEVDMAFHKRSWLPDPRGPQFGTWSVLGDTSLVRIPSFRLQGQRLVMGMPYVPKQGPTTVDLLIRYARADGTLRLIIVNDKKSWLTRDLFFIPSYSVYFASKRINIGWDLFPRILTGETLGFFSNIWPRGWEEYCKVNYVSISKPGFAGTPQFRLPCGSQRDPSIGYEVSMPGGTSGSFNVIYQVVCPTDFKPSGSEFFHTWTYAAPYGATLAELKANHGMPSDRFRRQSSVAGSCSPG